MYANPQYFVMINGVISPKFSSSNGVNQGCSLSPILSNIFQNDIHDIFQGCHHEKFPVFWFSYIIWYDNKSYDVNRKDKAMKMANMLLRALKTSCNGSAKLSMSLFDKYVAPIFTYGSSLWGIPKTFALLYLDDQPEDRDTRVTVTNMLQTCCSQSVQFTSARRVGRNGPKSTRRILIHFKNVQHMELIL